MEAVRCPASVVLPLPIGSLVGVGAGVASLLLGTVMFLRWILIIVVFGRHDYCQSGTAIR